MKILFLLIRKLWYIFKIKIVKIYQLKNITKIMAKDIKKSADFTELMFNENLYFQYFLDYEGSQHDFLDKEFHL